MSRIHPAELRLGSKSRSQEMSREMSRIHPAELRLGSKSRSQEMSRIHPAEIRLDAEAVSVSEDPRVWTVWKKSSMDFQGTDGFSVYDSAGKLAFRVENYSRRNKYLFEELVLMDGAGNALLSLWPQMLSMRDRWNATRASDSTKAGINYHVFSLRRKSILHQVDEAEVFLAQSSTPSFVISGSYWKRSCKILDSSGKTAAEICKKKLSHSVEIGDDVFNLILKPGVDSQLIMAIVVIMDRIFHKSCGPFMCSS